MNVIGRTVQREKHTEAVRPRTRARRKEKPRERRLNRLGGEKIDGRGTGYRVERRKDEREST